MRTSLRLLSAAATVLLTVQTLGAQTVTQSAGTTYYTNGPIIDDVSLNQMNGVSVRAYWGSTFRDYTMGSLFFGTAFGVNDGSLRLSGLPIGNSFFEWWSIDNKASTNLTRLVIDAASTRILFDRGTPSPGTSGSNIGFDLNACSLAVLVCLTNDPWDTQVLYTNQVALNPDEAAGDLYRTMDISFNNGGVTRGFIADGFIRFDSDRSLAPVVTPEPSTYALMAAGLAGLFAAARRRRRA